MQYITHIQPVNHTYISKINNIEKMKEDKEDFIQTSLMVQPKKIRTHVASEYLQSYLQNIRMKTIKEIDQETGEKYSKSFQLHNIALNIKNFEEPSIIFYCSDRTNDIITALVTLGFFKMSLMIANLNKPCPFQNIHFISKGQFGEVYLCEFIQEIFIAKFFRFKKDSDRKKMVINAVKEYAITKIASVLECSPKTLSKYEVELFCFNDGILFFIEKADEMSHQYDISSMQQSLSLLHQFHLVHNDIKPPNIKYSQTLNKPIFIDFGLSDVIEQKRGQKTLTSFKGTLHFCSPEMEKAFLNQSQDYIDLYYNDSQCLIKTFKDKFFETQQEAYKCYVEDNIMRECENFFFVIIFKCHLLKNNLPKLKSFLRMNKKSVIKLYAKNILQILMECDMSLELKKLIYEDLYFLQHEEQYQLLKSKFSFNSFVWVQSIGKQQKENENHNQNQNQSFQFNKLFYFNKITTNQTSPLNFSIFYNNYETFEKRLSLQEYLKIYSQFLSFQQNKYKIAEIQRQLIASLMKARVINESSNSNPLQNIKECFKYLLKKLLSINSCKIDLLLDIIYENVLLNNDIRCQFNEIEAFFKSETFTLFEKFSIYTQCKSLITVLMYKNCNQDLGFVSQTLLYFQVQSQMQLSQCCQMNNIIQKYFEVIHQKEIEIQHHTKIDYWNSNGYVCIFQSFYALQNQLVDQRVRRMINYYTIIKIIAKFLFCGQITVAMILLQKFPVIKGKIFDNNRVNLKIGFALLYSLCIQSKNYEVIRKIALALRQQFHYKQIYDTFIFQTYDFLFSQTVDSYLLQKCLNGFLASYQSKIKGSRYIELNRLCIKIDQHPTFMSKNSQLIGKIVNEMLRDIHKIKIETALDVENFFMQASNVIQSTYNFLSYLEDEGKSFVVVASTNCNQTKDLKEEILSAFYNLKKRNYEESFSNFRNILAFSMKFKNYLGIECCYQNILITLYHQKKRQQLLSYSTYYYKFCCTIANFFGYYASNTIRFIFITIESFIQANSIQLSFKFLLSMSSFITFHINKQCFLQWIDSISLVYELYPNLFVFQNLNLYFDFQFTWKNVYKVIYCAYSLEYHQNEEQIAIKLMKILAKNLCNLKPYAKDFIYSKYYSACLSSMSMSEKKRLTIYNKQINFIESKQICIKYQKIMKKKLILPQDANSLRKIMKLRMKLKKKQTIFHLIQND